MDNFDGVNLINKQVWRSIIALKLKNINESHVYIQKTENNMVLSVKMDDNTIVEEELEADESECHGLTISIV